MVSLFRLSASCVLVIAVFVGGGCNASRTWEIDTASVPEFKWNGRVRISERMTWELGPFLNLVEHTAAESVELLGAGQNIVLRPSGTVVEDHPIARLETPGFARDPAAVLAMKVVQHATGITATQPSGEPANDQELSEAITGHFAAAEHMQRGEYSQLSTTEAVVAASTTSRSNYTIYMMDDGRCLKAWFDGANPSSIVAVVLDRDGKVLHEYKPTPLNVVETTPKK